MFSSKGRIALFDFSALLICSLLASCSTPPPTESSPITLEPTPSSPPKIITIPPTEIPSPTEIATIIPTQSISGREINLPLSEAGEYFTGKKVYSFVDAARKNRKVSITVWYPAIRPLDFISNYSLKDAEPDKSGSPYPLIISSTKIGNVFAPHLASYGFIVAGVNNQDSYYQYGDELIDYPKDQLFVLDQIGAGSMKELKGVVDAEHTGAMGYSFDGYNALALSGARVDPDFYVAQCKNANTIQPPLPKWWINYICALQDTWLEFAAHAGTDLTTSKDGLWQPMTDPRIKAVMPMAPEGAWLFGERGLAAVDRPVLIIGTQLDEINYYYLETAFIYDHIGNTDKTLITFMNEGHMMVLDPSPVKKMEHFAVAFFGYHLQNKAEYQDYYSEDFISKYPDFYWGVYPGK